MSLRMLGLVGSGHMMNTTYFYQQSKKKQQSQKHVTGAWRAAIEESYNGFTSRSVVNSQIIIMKLIIEQLSWIHLCYIYWSKGRN